jgi:hypothetical protein
MCRDMPEIRPLTGAKDVLRASGVQLEMARPRRQKNLFRRLHILRPVRAALPRESDKGRKQPGRDRRKLHQLRHLRHQMPRQMHRVHHGKGGRAHFGVTEGLFLIATIKKRRLSIKNQ